jgi:hypothetical protein
MRKLIMFATAAMALLAIPSIASADTPRYQMQTATFTVLQPKDAVGQFDNVWRHEFSVTVNPCDGTFSGTAPTYNNGATTPTWTEKVTGSFGDGSVSFATNPIGGGATFQVTDAAYGESVLAVTTWTDNIVETKAKAPAFTNSSNFKNHGDYVKSQGGGSDAAHSCIGMPIVSGK